jgi:hypothetical protein
VTIADESVFLSTASSTDRWTIIKPSLVFVRANYTITSNPGRIFTSDFANLALVGINIHCPGRL